MSWTLPDRSGRTYDATLAPPQGWLLSLKGEDALRGHLEKGGGNKKTALSPHKDAFVPHSTPRNLIKE